MASLPYALPVSPVPHSHLHSPAHSHSHSAQSLSPNKIGPATQRSPNSKNLRQERSNGSLHLQARSDSSHDHGHNHNHSVPPAYSGTLSSGIAPNGNGLNGHSHNHSHTYSATYSPFVKGEKDSTMASHTHNDHDHCHHDHDHKLDHSHSHDHSHDHDHVHKGEEKRSAFTKLLMSYCQGYPTLHSILIEKDSRRIFYFMTLNFAFMTVQAFYGYLTDSLGLLSDSIHMFFDCLALGLGLFAAVASKWPRSERFPYGFGKIETLSGFGNGVFLMLISIEIIIEAVERLAEGHETKRLTELFAVSSLGLLVNLVGMMCFGHHHHGHDHSHGGHEHEHSHGHDHHDHGTPALTVQAPPKAHNHSHEDENMRGIFLHVLADTLGSAAVIVSTILMSTIGWAGWDPLASCLIAILIFAASVPLVTSCAKKLLLTVPGDTEYQLRNTLAGISGLRGVASYSVPRFWIADKSSGSDAKEVQGVMHISAIRGQDLDDLRERARTFLSSNGMDVVVQVEREGDGKCWCGGDGARTPSTNSSRFS